MNQKFDPSYLLSIEKTSKEGEFINIKLPFTMEAKVIRNNFANSVSSEIAIYNLNEITRSEIHKHFTEQDVLKKISLVAGYGSNRSLIFTGIVFECHTERVGVDVITRIQCHDCGESVSANGFSKQYSEGTSVSTAINDMLKYLEQFGVSIGAVSDSYGAFTKDEMFGPGVNVIDHIRSIVGNSFYIDNNVSYVLGTNEVSSDPALVISSESGLLDAPVYEGGANVKVKMVFEPNAKVGQKAIVKNNLNKKLNGDYKIIGISHDLKISYSHGGINISTFTLTKGTGLIRISK